VYSTVVGINLLREGLDLPEVSLVAIMDADKEGFLRSEVSLIQTIGRASRNVNGKVILYADIITNSIAKALEETNRRRKKQIEYNLKYNIEPASIRKAVKDLLDIDDVKEDKLSVKNPKDITLLIQELEEEMHYRASMLEFEEAAKLRDKIKKLKNKLLTKVVNK
jgi:excinuclease ABC subunit B